VTPTWRPTELANEVDRLSVEVRVAAVGSARGRLPSAGCCEAGLRGSQPRAGMRAQPAVSAQRGREQPRGGVGVRGGVCGACRLHRCRGSGSVSRGQLAGAGVTVR